MLQRQGKRGLPWIIDTDGHREEDEIANGKSKSKRRAKAHGKRSAVSSSTKQSHLTIHAIDSSDSDTSRSDRHSRTSSSEENADGSTCSGTRKRAKAGYFTQTEGSSKAKSSSKARSTAAAPTEFVTGGVRIKFPFAPYKSQKDMMSRIVEALQTEENALLESPTGSGKSLALLCGALAWLESEKANRASAFKARARDLKLKMEQQGVVESPYFAVETPKAGNHSSSTLTSAIGSPASAGCGSCIASCGSNAPSEVKEEPCGVSSSGLKTSLAQENEDTSEDDQDFQTSKGRDVKKRIKLVELEYDGEISLSEVEVKAQEKLPENLGQGYSGHGGLPKIYFGSRTHKQITQLVKELKSNTVYRPKMVVLGSRNHYCINPRLKKVINKNDACQELLDGGGDGKGCHQRGRANELSSAFSQLKKGKNRIWDMEDLIVKGKALNGCPYFASRSLATEAELVFCPYSYLIDPQIRKAMEINLENAIVILDEAHNIEDASREAGGLEVSDDDLQTAAKQFEDMVQNDAFGQHGHMLRNLSTMFLSILENQTTFSMQDYEQSSEIWTSQEMLASLDNLGLNRHTIHNYERACHEVSKALKEQKERIKEGKKHARTYQDSADVSDAEKLKREVDMHLFISPRVLRTMEGIVTVISRLLDADLDCLDDYKVALVESVDRGRSNDGGGRNDGSEEDAGGTTAAAGKQKKKNLFNRPSRGRGVRTVREFKFWCLNPGVIFRPISSKARSVILTSGTLSPMDSFASELQTSFKIQLEADHVVQKSQVWAGVLPYGPTHVKIDGTFRSAVSFPFQDELGRVVERIIETTPHGVLCFVSSYSLMDNLMQRWRATGQYDRLSAIKKVMQEPRKATTKEFDETLRDFYDHISKHVEEGSDGGALLFAVFRGKCSEGIDFTDSNCRAVLAVSIPFPGLHDLKIKLKKEYNDQQSQRHREYGYARLQQAQALARVDIQGLSHSTGGSAQSVQIATAISMQRASRPLLSGKRWYEIQAFRAFNQAIGRCIRHQKDWGAMVLLDHRFTQPNNQQGLSKWVRPLVKTFKDFERGIDDMKDWIRPLRTNGVFFETVAQASKSDAQNLEMPTTLDEAEVELMDEEQGLLMDVKQEIDVAGSVVGFEDRAIDSAEQSTSYLEEDTTTVHNIKQELVDDKDLVDAIMIAAAQQIDEYGQHDMLNLAEQESSVKPGRLDPPDSWVGVDMGAGRPEAIAAPSPCRSMSFDQEWEEDDWEPTFEADVTADLDADFDAFLGGGSNSDTEAVSTSASVDTERFFEATGTVDRDLPMDPVGSIALRAALPVSLVTCSEDASELGREEGITEETLTTARSSVSNWEVELSAINSSVPGLTPAQTPQIPVKQEVMLASVVGSSLTHAIDIPPHASATLNGSSADSAFRVVCKSCDAPLLSCLERPKIRTVQKSMANELLLNRRRAAQNGVYATTSSIQQPTSEPTGMPSLSLRPHSQLLEVADSASVPRAMILAVHKSHVLDMMFDTQHGANELDCVWRPQDGLFYRRVECPKCRTAAESVSFGRPAMVSMALGERVIPGWKGVMIVGRSSGEPVEEDGMDDIGTIWLTPGEIRTL